MTGYSKGRQFEYRVRDYLKRRGWVVFRSAGSHSLADLIALRAGEIWLVQCKTDGYMLPSERSNFIEVSKELGVVPILAYRDERRLVLAEIKKLEEG